VKQPAINSYIEISELSNNRYMVYNRYTKKTFCLGKNEYNVLIHLDGINSLSELEKYTEYSQREIEYIIKFFEGAGFLDTSEIKRKINILKLSIRLFNPNKLFKSIIFTNILSSILLFGTFPLLFVGVILNIVMGSNLMNVLSDIFISVSSPSVLIALPIIFIVTFLHEMGHVVVAKRYRVNVNELGFMLYWFVPTAYVNLASVNLLKKKYQKILVYSAGIFTNLFILALVFMVRPFIPKSFQFIVSWFAMGTMISVIFNLFIFLKFDGYFIFKEIVDIPELREKSFKYLLYVFKRFINIRRLNSLSRFYIQIDTNEYTALQRSVLICYGLLSILFIPVLLMSIGISILTIFFI